jgi:CrcB protein
MPSPLTSSALVGLGGFAGSIARYGLSVAFQRFSFEWPLGTMAANLLGCFVIGVISSLAERTEAISPASRLLLATGFCGGFTTMSSMVYESMQMLRSGEYLHGALYVGATLAGSALAFVAGAVMVRLLILNAGE